MHKIHTRGNVIVNDIKIGDTHYEFENGLCVQSEVISEPVYHDGNWSWESKRISNGEIINYLVNEKYPHYGPNLYDYIAYGGCRMI